MGLIIFKAGVRSPRAGTWEPDVDYNLATEGASASAMYSADESECIVFYKGENSEALRPALASFNMVIFTGEETEAEFKALSKCDYAEFKSNYELNTAEEVPSYGLGQ